MHHLNSTTTKIRCPIDWQAEFYPYRAALCTENMAWSYLEFNQRIQRLQLLIKQLNLPRFSVISIECDMRHYPNILALLWAVWRLSFSVLLIDPYLPAPQISNLLEFSGSKLHIGHFLPKNIKHLTLPLVSSYASQSVSPKVKSPEFLNQRAIASLILSSGSSALPKLIGHRFSSLLAAARGSNEFISLDATKSWALSLPIHHISGLAIIWRCALAGAKIAILPLHQGWQPGVLQLCPTHISLVPTQLYDWVEHSLKVPSIETILVGGASTPESLVKRAILAQLPIRLSYGSSEMGGQITTTEILDIHSRLDRYGFSIPNRHIRINAKRQIEVSGPCLFAGYWTGFGWQKETTSDSWFTTGDLGELDEQGLSIQGRIDTMFISGGKNIYPEEIEDTVLQKLGVRACVTPVSDARFGQVGVLVLDSDQIFTNIKSTLKSYLPNYKIPKYWVNWPNEINRSTLKFPRKQLEQWVAHHCSNLHKIAS